MFEKSKENPGRTLYCNVLLYLLCRHDNIITDRYFAYFFYGKGYPLALKGVQKFIVKTSLTMTNEYTYTKIVLFGI
jgi:hypothetical protein